MAGAPAAGLPGHRDRPGHLDRVLRFRERWHTGADRRLVLHVRAASCGSTARRPACRGRPWTRSTVPSSASATSWAPCRARCSTSRWQTSTWTARSKSWPPITRSDNCFAGHAAADPGAHQCLRAAGERQCLRRRLGTAHAQGQHPPESHLPGAHRRAPDGWHPDPAKAFLPVRGQEGKVKPWIVVGRRRGLQGVAADAEVPQQDQLGVPVRGDLRHQRHLRAEHHPDHHGPGRHLAGRGDLHHRRAQRPLRRARARSAGQRSTSRCSRPRKCTS